MVLILEHLFSGKSSVLWTGVREPQKMWWKRWRTLTEKVEEKVSVKVSPRVYVSVSVSVTVNVSERVSEMVAAEVADKVSVKVTAKVAHISRNLCCFSLLLPSLKNPTAGRRLCLPSYFLPLKKISRSNLVSILPPQRPQSSPAEQKQPTNHTPYQRYNPAGKTYNHYKRPSDKAEQ